MAKRLVCKKLQIETPSNVSLLKAYHNLLKQKIIKGDKNLENILIKRRIRSLSGIVIVSVLTKPYKCPGNCLYCPKEKNVPKSYLKKEPAVMRAILNNYHPYLQVQSRLKSLKATGHPIDKIDLRIIGGTWSFYPKKYQTEFIKQCFSACNNFEKKKIKIGSLKNEQKRNEKAKNRIIGISVETRPDFINKEEIKRLRKLGITRVELGVQSIYDDVLEKNQRGHLTKETIRATKMLKDAGFKICYQMMPNLFGSTVEKDKKMFKEIFKNPNFMPDMLKIYPCSIIKSAPLYKLWKEKKYKPYSRKKLMDLIKYIKSQTPYWLRIQRIIRDIPAEYIVEGPTKISNLRQLIRREIKCKCIRCREVGENYNPKEKVYLYCQNYNASEGKEIFLSYENKNRSKLYSLLRIRIPSYFFKNENHFLPILNGCAIIREIHTYGKLVPINSKEKISAQHKGLGKKLVKEAEKIVLKKFGIKKIAVISGIGAREYFRNLGYKLKNTYMIKKLTR